jgi:hypothetical protein
LSLPLPGVVHHARALPQDDGRGRASASRFGAFSGMSRHGDALDPDTWFLRLGKIQPAQAPLRSPYCLGAFVTGHFVTKACAQHDIPTDVSVGEALEELSNRIANGDAGVPTGRVGAVDAEGLDDEVVERIMKHMDGRLSPAALGQLKEMLEGGPDEYDYMPPGLRDKASRDQLERQIEHLDPRSASDALENIEAIELMRQRGNLERGAGERMAERRGSEPWHPGRNEPPGSDLPRAAGKQHAPGSLVPSEHHKLAGDAALKSFAKLCGVKKKHLPRSI